MRWTLQVLGDRSKTSDGAQTEPETLQCMPLLFLANLEARPLVPATSREGMNAISEGF
jgi:hypothetical protein